MVTNFSQNATIEIKQKLNQHNKITHQQFTMYTCELGLPLLSFGQDGIWA